MDVVYNAKPAIENALRSAGWMMSNIVKNIGFSAEASKDYVARRTRPSPHERRTVRLHLSQRLQVLLRGNGLP